MGRNERLCRHEEDHFEILKIKKIETVTENHNWLKKQNNQQLTVGCLAPMNTSTSHPLQLRIRGEKGVETLQGSEDQDICCETVFCI